LVARSAELLHTPGISVVADATALLEAGGVTALHDPTEGGLAMGIRELAIAAGCGATVDREAIPILPETAAIASELGLDPIGILASGSLLASADPAAVDQLVAAGAAAGIPVTPIGEVTAATAGLRLRTGDATIDLPDYVSDEVTRVL
jgi:hydrogenase maturation factor